MARPKKEGLDYFPHDTDAVNDEKIEGLRMLYGNGGYAFYFILLERIYRTKDQFLDISDAETRQIFVRKIGVDDQKFDRMLNTALKLGCFDQEAYKTRAGLTSNGIMKRASVVLEKRVKARQKREEMDRPPETDDGVSDAETTQQTVGQTPESKVKESKVKESKKENTGIPDSATGKPATSDAPKGKPKTTSRRVQPMVDEDFLKALEINPAFKGIDIRKEYGKMQAWFLTPRGHGKQPTRTRFLNWLNRAEPTERKGNANGSTNQKPINQIACPSGSTDRGMAAIERMRENVRKRAELREARRLQGEDHPTGGTGKGNALPGVPQAPEGERGPSSAGGDPRTGPASPIHAGVTSEKVRGPDAGKLDGPDAGPAPRS